MSICNSQSKVTWLIVILFIVVVNLAFYKRSAIIEKFVPSQTDIRKILQDDDASTRNSSYQKPSIKGFASGDTARENQWSGAKSTNRKTLWQWQGGGAQFPVATENPLKVGQKHLPFMKDAVVNPHNFTYVISPRVSCRHRIVDLAICVPISRKNFQARQVVRETWGSYANQSSHNAILLFFVGSGTEFEPPDIQTHILEESETYGDILQEDYIDSYNNLSLKSVSILKWARTYCAHTKFVLKADDDMYVNIPFMMNMLLEMVVMPKTPNVFVMGSKQVGAKPQRTSSSKWFTSLSSFAESVYPDYVSGTAYVMTIQAVALLYEASLRVPLFWLEDIYITGICARKADVTIIDNKAFTYSKPTATGCVFKDRVSGHRYTLEQIQTIHKELYDPSIKC